MHMPSIPPPPDAPPPPRERPVAALIIGIVLLVFGAKSLGECVLGMLAFKSLWETAVTLPVTRVALSLIALTVIIAVLLIVAGIALLRLARWARIFAIAILYALLFCEVTLAIIIRMSAPMPITHFIGPFVFWLLYRGAIFALERPGMRAAYR